MPLFLLDGLYHDHNLRRAGLTLADCTVVADPPLKITTLAAIRKLRHLVPLYPSHSAPPKP
jgi:hypothetical protein